MSAAQVPARAMLKAMFPTGERTTWEKKANTFEVGFMLNGKAMLTVITPAGALQETETDMSTSELPAAVRSTLARDYKAYKINEAATIVRANGTTVYEAGVAKGGKKHGVLFTADGRVAPK